VLDSLAEHGCDVEVAEESHFVLLGGCLAWAAEHESVLASKKRFPDGTNVSP
jgi:hypothetical protein